MTVLSLLLLLLPGLAVDPVPDESEVGTGWVAAVVVGGLLLATVLLWFSMRKQLRKVEARRRAEEDTGDTGA